MATIICDLCPRECSLLEGRTGFCGVRTNRQGENVDATRDLLESDPPYPRGEIWGVPTYVAWLPGCNMRCWFCCYPGITRTDIPDRRNLERLSPREFIDEAHAWTIPKVVFFGGEPALHHEYWSEATDLARECGLETGIHTNGYVNPWLAEKIASSFDEVVIGIKGSASRELYEKMTANSKVPLETLAIISHINPNVGVALLVSEAFQVSPEDDYRLGAYVRKNAGADIRVVLMTAREPPPNPPGLYYSNYTPVLSAATSAYKYSLQVGERLIQSGLTDVEVYDTRPNLRALSLDSSALRRLPIPRQRKCERSSLNPKRAQATIPSRD